MATNQILRDTFPDWVSGSGIFTAIQNLPWSNTVDGTTLDIEYFGNHSGYKFCAPLIYNFLDDTGKITEAGRTAIGKIIAARYLKPWTRLWNLLSSEYDPLDNYHVEEAIDMKGTLTGTEDLVGSVKNGGTSTLTGTGGDTLERTGTDNLAHTGKDTTKTASDGAIQDIVNNKGTGENGRYGFNSAVVQPTHTSTQGSASEAKRTTKNADTSEVERATNDDRTLNLTDKTTRDTTDTRTDNLTQDTTNNTSTERSTTDKGTRTRSGISGLYSRQRLVEQERQAWTWDFFESVFADVDKVLALAVYDPRVMRNR